MPLPEPHVASIGNQHPFLVAFRSARFRFRLRAVSHVELPAEKGSTFHGATLDSETKRRLVDRTRAIEITSHDLYWDDWSRYSGRQHTWMKFGGLLGEITYRGNLTPFLPWLALGEWTHIGGKTSFGLGRYTIGPPQQG